MGFGSVERTSGRFETVVKENVFRVSFPAALPNVFIFFNFCVARRFSGILNCEDLTEVDPVRGRFLRQIQSLIARKSRIAQDNTLSPEARAHQIQNLALVSSSGPVVRLEDLAITFTYLPSSQVFGFSAAELTPGSCDKEVNFPAPFISR